MKKILIPIGAVAFFCATLFVVACTQSTKDEHQEGVEEHHHADSGETQNHHTDSDEKHHEGSDDGTTLWTPSGNATELINADFHFIAGEIEDINPQIITDDQGENVLELTANGSQAALVFHKSYGNVGVAISLNRTDFDGTIKVIHHAKTSENYQYVAIENNNMSLGKITEGNETIFDDGTFSEDNQEWITLRASAAGTHYKGYLGNETITHGHGDQMKDGYVGIMMKGTGKVLIKSIEVVPMEAE